MGEETFALFAILAGLGAIGWMVARARPARPDLVAPEETPHDEQAPNRLGEVNRRIENFAYNEPGLDALDSALGDPDPQVRLMLAARTRSASDLVALAKSPGISDALRIQSLGILIAHFDLDQVVPVLRFLLVNDGASSRVRQYAVRALGRLRCPTAVD